VQPIHHIFGSDELSSRAPVMAERLATAYVSLSTADAQRLRVADQQTIVLGLNMKLLKLTARIDEMQAEGTVGLPIGLMVYLWCKVTNGLLWSGRAHNV
jgi:NADH-quinone oxidoreductase subunit G